jgi:hypothetical protein
MANPANIEPVKLICGLIFGNETIYLEVLGQLEGKFSQIEFESEIFPFDHTNYYAKEMGDNLSRGFISFTKAILPDKLKEAKLFAAKLEKKYLNRSGGRVVNIDPGTVSLANLTLASTKDFAHRVYLGSGIFAEVTMIYNDKAFRPLPWTYPDYQRSDVAEFLLRTRNSLKEEIIDLRNR